MHLDRTLLLYGPKNVLQLKGPINIEEGYADMNGYRASGEDATGFDLYATVKVCSHFYLLPVSAHDHSLCNSGRMLE